MLHTLEYEYIIYIYFSVGESIYVQKVENPTQEQINELHTEFTKSLVSLFEENKHKYITDPEKRKLIIE